MAVEVIGGVDTHKDSHTAAVLSSAGRILGVEPFPADGRGYRDMLDWMSMHGCVVRVGVECTGSYGAGVARFLSGEGIEVCEVMSPDKAERRRHGKDDSFDAESAARAAAARVRVAIPKSHDGEVESLRVLCMARRSAVKARRVVLQMISAQVISAPELLTGQLKGLPRMMLIRKLAVSRPNHDLVNDPVVATKMALRGLARRYLALSGEIDSYETPIRGLVTALAPDLLASPGIGIQSAATLLITAGDNPGRLRSEAAFAMLCGVAPIPASSGKTERYRLNHGGDRNANSALHIIAVNRLRCDERTQRYIERRRAEGLSNMEIIRCLKRYIAREVYHALAQGRSENPPIDS